MAAPRAAPVFGIGNTTDAALPPQPASQDSLRPAQKVAYTMLGLSSMMLVIGLITDKRNAAKSNQTKWMLDAVMIGWFVMVLSVLRRYVWFPPKAETAKGEPVEASVAAAVAKPDPRPASNGSSGTDADDEEDEDAIVVRRRRVRRDN